MAASQCSIGITGGIGSGKSYVADILRHDFGIPVYDCDAEAKRLTASDHDIRRQLTELVGDDVFRGEHLVRQRLADFLFSSEENARKVNSIIHPAVLRDFCQWAGKQSAPVVAMESAILFESGFNTKVDKVLFVDAPEEVRLERAMLRDAASKEQIRARMTMQQPENNKCRADFVIDNSTATEEEIIDKLTKFLIEST